MLAFARPENAVFLLASHCPWFLVEMEGEALVAYGAGQPEMKDLSGCNFRELFVSRSRSCERQGWTSLLFLGEEIVRLPTINEANASHFVSFSLTWSTTQLLLTVLNWQITRDVFCKVLPCSSLELCLPFCGSDGGTISGHAFRR